ncbi:MAG: Dyp-type peroxidase [Myxococcota bacterium]
MTAPQSGIFAEGTAHHYFLEWQLHPGVEDEAIRQQVSAALEAEDPQADRSGQHLVVAFGDSVWKRLTPGPAPEKLRPFANILGMDDTEAPDTQNDVLFWIHGPKIDENLARAVQIAQAMSRIADAALDLPAFVFRDSRDLTGFIDGSANPQGDARQAAALIPEGEAGAGGTYVMTQRWIHDLRAWNRLSDSEQEAVIGRTKPDSVEFESHRMPADAHVARSDVSEDGTPLKIYRRSVPYGTASEHGLLFLCFACDLHRIEVILHRMLGTSGDGVRDRITDFTRPATGSFWFAPSEAELAGALGR